MAKQKRVFLTKQKKAILSACVVAIFLMIGFTYAWFVDYQNFTTVSKVMRPSDIIIAGEEGKNITEINLEYTDSDVDEYGKITVDRVVCVKSLEHDFYLELAQTTNIDGLKISLHPATQVKQGDDTYEYHIDKTLDGQNSTVGGQYLNPSVVGDTDPTTASTEATKEEYNKTYFETDADVQVNAVPLYWLSERQTVEEKKPDETYYVQYYVISATWDEKEKETDLIYLLASNNLISSNTP